MKWLVFIQLAFAVAVSSAAANVSYIGRVFEDRDADGVFGKGDRPLPGVMVSDGLNVVPAGNDGMFSLPHRGNARFIFVTTPSGYMAAEAYYMKTGTQTETYDFPLVPYDAGIRKDESHTFIQVTDTEIFNTDNNEEWVDNIRQCATVRNAAFIVHTGDICYEKGLESHIGLMNTENMGVPVYYGIGNHDLVKGRYGEELYESIYGPAWYSFDVAGTHYVMLPMLSGDFKPSYTQDDVAAWLANDLAHVPQDTPVVVFSHNILTYGNSFLYKGTDGPGVDLDSRNLKAWIYGHIHTNHVRQQGDVLTFCTSPSDKGGVDHSMGGFRIFTVSKEGDVSSELRFPYLYHRARIASPSGETSSAQLTVNAYSTTADVESVTASCFVGDKSVFGNLRLTRCTDWSWNALMPLKDKYAGRKMSVKAEIRFSDGHIETAESEFVYSPSSSVVSLTDDWTNLRGNASHTACASSIDGPLHLSWVTNVGADIFMTSPIVYDGRVYTATTDEDMKRPPFVCALDGTDGSILWKYPTRGSVKNTIAIEKGLVFAQDIEGWMYAVDAVTGKLAWETRLPVDEGRPPLIDGLAANDGIVYAGSGKGLSAWDALSGRMLWKNGDWSQREGTTSTLAVGSGVVVGGVQWMALYGNNAKTGKMLWSHSDFGLRNRGASPAIHDGRIFVVSQNSFFIIGAVTGKILVRKELPFSLDATSTPLLTGKSVIFGTADSGVVALDRETLEVKWNFPTGNALICTVPYSRPSARSVETSPVLSGNTVYFGASDGVLYGLDVETGEKVWSHETGAPIFSSVAVSGNTLIVSDFGGNVYAFSSRQAVGVTL